MNYDLNHLDRLGGKLWKDVVYMSLSHSLQQILTWKTFKFCSGSFFGTNISKCCMRIRDSWWSCASCFWSSYMINCVCSSRDGWLLFNFLSDNNRDRFKKSIVLQLTSASVSEYFPSFGTETQEILESLSAMKSVPRLCTGICNIRSNTYSVYL